MARFRFVNVEADGEYVLVHVVVTFGPLEHPISVRLTEDDAQTLIGKVQAAIARLGRTRLPAGAAR
jgi:hypothetical protein